MDFIFLLIRFIYVTDPSSDSFNVQKYTAVMERPIFCGRVVVTSTRDVLPSRWRWGILDWVRLHCEPLQASANIDFSRILLWGNNPCVQFDSCRIITASNRVILGFDPRRDTRYSLENSGWLCSNDAVVAANWDLRVVGLLGASLCYQASQRSIERLHYLANAIVRCVDVDPAIHKQNPRIALLLDDDLTLLGLIRFRWCAFHLKEDLCGLWQP